MTFDLTPGEDQTQILDAAQSLLDSHYPLSRLRDPTPDPLTPLAEFGAFTLALPESEGGTGFTVLEEALLHAALGRHLVTPSALATALSARMGGAAEAPACAGVPTDTGALIFDPDGATSCVLLGADGPRLIPLDPATLTPEPALGHGRPMARLDHVPANAPAPQPQTLLAALLTSAQLLGVAIGARDLAVDYARIREQFGRPIGSFQSIKHHCANMLLGTEMLSAQLDMAALALRDGTPDAPFQIAALARLAPRTALQNARLGIQIHGGIGFSAEADAQLFLKQAHLLAGLMPPLDLLSAPAPMAPHKEA